MRKPAARSLLLVRLAVTLAAVALFLVLLRQAGQDRSLYYRSHSLLTAWLPAAPRPDPRIVVVALDDATLGRPDIPQWGAGVISRRAHARALREMNGGGAAVVGYDIAFIGPSPPDGEPGPAPDASFRQELERARSAVLVVEARSRSREQSALDRFVEPHDVLRGASPVRLASPKVRRFAESGQVLGVVPEQESADGRTLNAFSFELAKAFQARDDMSASFDYATVGTNDMLVIRWPMPPAREAFRTVSFADVWDGTWREKDPELFRNRIVLVGSFVTMGRADEQRTPVGMLPGVLIHAAALQTLLNRDWIRDDSYFLTWTLAALAGMVAAAGCYRLRPTGAVLSVLGALVLVMGVCLAALHAGRTWVGPFHGGLTVLLASVIALAWRGWGVRRALSQFAGAEAAEQIDVAGRLDTRRREATILFADLRSYTTLSESLDPSEVMSILNEHFRWVDALILKHGGVVDKHIGDAVMAIFADRTDGRPGRGPGHARRALEAAIEMAQLAPLRRGPAAAIDFGVGLHTGDITTGALGAGKTEYGSVGDAVNVAARLEGATRDAGVTLLASAETVRQSGLEERMRCVGPIQLKGRVEPVQGYTLPDPAEEPVARDPGGSGG